MKQGDTLGEYLQEGALNGRPYFRKQNNTAKKDFFMFFSGRRWLVGNALGDEFSNLRNRKMMPDIRDAFLMGLLQTIIHRIRVKKLSDKLPVLGWQYADPDHDDWQEDTSLVLEWLSQEPCRRIKVIKEAGNGPKIVLWRDILALEEAGRTAKMEIAFLLLLICWGREKRRS